MEKHFELSDDEFEQRFIRCELDPSLFSHEAHLRLAYIHIERYGIAQAEKNLQAQLQRFVKLLGAEDKYNATLTIAAAKAVHHFMQKSKSTGFADFIVEFPRLKFQFKELMAQHYGTGLLNSDDAKSAFLEPDLLPFT